MLFREWKEFGRVTLATLLLIFALTIFFSYLSAAELKMRYFPQTSDMVFADFLKSNTPAIFNSDKIYLIGDNMFLIEVYYLVNSSTPAQFSHVPRLFWSTGWLSEKVQKDFEEKFNAGKIDYILTCQGCLEPGGLTDRIAAPIRSNFSCRDLNPPDLPKKNFTYCIRRGT